MKKMRMMTGILGSCLNTVVQWGNRMKNKRTKNKNVKKRHHRMKNKRMNNKKVNILGPTLLERPRGPLCNRRDARDEESLREPARHRGCVWEDKRYTGGKGGQETYERKRRHASKAVRGSSQLRSYQSREGNIF